MTKTAIRKLTYAIIGAAIDIHEELGPGLLEKVYEECMVYELRDSGIMVERQKTVPLIYKGRKLDIDLRYDLLVENSIVVEVKAVQKMNPVFEAQAMSYARLLKVPKAILINFTCDNIFNQGQRTFVNEFYNNLPD